MQTKIIDRVTLLNITLIVEAFLLSAATVWSWLCQIQLLPALTFVGRQFLYGALCGLAMSAGSLLLLWLGSRVKVLGNFRSTTINEIAPVFSELTWWDALLVASVSGFCEEVLFRGVIQAQCGLAAAAAIFAFFHCPAWRYISYGIWAFAAGLFLGWLYQSTGSLWVPIATHAVSNAVALAYLKHLHKKPGGDTGKPASPP